MLGTMVSQHTLLATFIPIMHLDGYPTMHLTNGCSLPIYSPSDIISMLSMTKAGIYRDIQVFIVSLSVMLPLKINLEIMPDGICKLMHSLHVAC